MLKNSAEMRRRCRKTVSSPTWAGKLGLVMFRWYIMPT